VNGGYPARPFFPQTQVGGVSTRPTQILPPMAKHWLMKRARLRSSFKPPDRLAVWGGNAMNGGICVIAVRERSGSPCLYLRCAKRATYLAIPIITMRPLLARLNGRWR
jgi:hypothetical protein